MKIFESFAKKYNFMRINDGIYKERFWEEK